MLGMPVLAGTGPGRVPTFDPGSARPTGVAEAVDSFGRVARDLRISLTERCNLRCTYCMPEEGLPEVPADRLLTTDEVVRLVTVGVHELGIREVRLTGGEPLMRRDLEEIIARIGEEAPGTPVAITSNGLGLRHRARKLAEAGLSRVNISLDTIDREVFAEVTRRDRLPDVLAGIAAAQEAGLEPVKVNAVPLRRTIDGAADLLEWAIRERVQLRFIEQMPLDADQQWQRDSMVTAVELVEALSERFELEQVLRDDPADPAEAWRVVGGPGVEGYAAAGGRAGAGGDAGAGGGRAGAGGPIVGLIPTVTRPFCSACDRTRLTAEGTIRPCLFGDDETDLLGPLRAGASDHQLAELWRTATWHKWAGHDVGGLDFQRPERSMGAIGG